MSEHKFQKYDVVTIQSRPGMYYTLLEPEYRYAETVWSTDRNSFVCESEITKKVGTFVPVPKVPAVGDWVGHKRCHWMNYPIRKVIGINEGTAWCRHPNELSNGVFAELNDLAVTEEPKK